MCRRVTCSTCGKPTFAGCGLHIDAVLGDVPPAQRCQGHSEAKPAAALSWWPFGVRKGDSAKEKGNG